MAENDNRIVINLTARVDFDAGYSSEEIEKLVAILEPRLQKVFEEAAKKGLESGASGADLSGAVTPGSGGDAGANSKVVEATEKAVHATEDQNKTLEEIAKEVQGLSGNVERVVNADTDIFGRRDIPKGAIDEAGHLYGQKDSDINDRADAKWEEKWSPIIMKGVQMGASGLKSVATQSLGFVEMIYGYMKRSSPLMQSIESLFNLAVQLFFMPLGNKLAETILPATLDLVDAVLDIWDKFEGKSLGEMMEFAIKEGVKVFSSYIIDIGETLKDEKGIVGSIGNFLVTLGTFVEENGEAIITTILNVATTILENFKEFVSLYVGLMTAQIGATIGGSSILGNLLIPAGALIGAGAGFAIGAGGTYGAMSIAGFAEGGYVPSREGGTLAIVGEGGEGEHIVPESKADAFAASRMKGSNTYNITINGYTDSELKRYVQDIVSEQVSFSRLKGSFRWQDRRSSPCAGRRAET